MNQFWSKAHMQTARQYNRVVSEYRKEYLRMYKARFVNVTQCCISFELVIAEHK